jgi:Protein of unknown function (DUF3723)
VIQESESICGSKPESLADRVDLGMRQIFIFAMRNYLEMPVEPKRKIVLAKSTSEKAGQAVLCEFAGLAYRLGFESKEIRSLMQRSFDREIARDALLKARKPGRYEYDEAAFEHHLGQIVRMFSTARPVTAEQPKAALEADDSGGLLKRCGIPRRQDHERDKSSLFLSKLHEVGDC